MDSVGERIILEGVLQQFEGHVEAYEKLIKRLIPDNRIRKINSLRRSWK